MTACWARPSRCEGRPALPDQYHRIRRADYQYVKDGRDAFLASSLVQDATIRNFETIGQAARHVSTELRHAHPEIPWREVVGFRDVLIHDYLRVDVNELWNIVESALPDLKQKLAVILASLPFDL